MDPSTSSKSIGIVLLNLGSPDTPEPQSIRRFLASFLADKRVIQLPRLLWLPVLFGIILPFRPQKIAPLYRSIWGTGDGPMRSIGNKLALALQEKLNLLSQSDDHSFHVVTGMTYGNPSLQLAFKSLNERGCGEIIILPLFPQYSDPSTAAAFDSVERALKKVQVNSSLHFINHYYSHPLYINALVSQIQKHSEASGIDFNNKKTNSKLLMSFHGIPQSYADKGDPYPQHCEITAKLVFKKLAEKLNCSEQKFAFSYQSRFGKATWLKPYTDHLLEDWGKNGVEQVSIICPGFTVDCLETLEEIAIQNKEIFQNAGGKIYHYIPALNDGNDHVDLLFDIVNSKISEVQD